MSRGRVRPGSPEDVLRLFDLWRRDVRAGRQDATPGLARINPQLSAFDWEARSRVIEDGDRLTGAVLVTSRASPEGVIATVSVAGPPNLTHDITRWALLLARAGGARIVQVFVARGSRPLEAFGLEKVRPWLRMDRDLTDGVPRAEPVPGYRLLDRNATEAGTWEQMFNASFADHWRFTPRTEEEILANKPPQLCLMAVTAAGGPAAIALGEVEEYLDDARPQPVGLVSAVGTMPEHRRRGLAAWLVAEVLARLMATGARSVSLYVDGLNPMRAFDAYRKLGFEVAFETEVWEATFR